jgi:hypothetical protein
LFLLWILGKDDALFFMASAVANTSSDQKEMDWNWPILSSCPSGVKGAMPVSAPGIFSSIQRCFSVNG